MWLKEINNRVYLIIEKLKTKSGLTEDMKNTDIMVWKEWCWKCIK